MSPSLILAIFAMRYAANRYFEQLTGMTLDEWDEINYQRVMACED